MEDLSIKEIKTNILEGLKRNILFDNKVIVDNLYCVELYTDDKIKLLSFQVDDSEKFIKDLEKNNYNLSIPEWIDLLEKNSLYSLVEIYDNVTINKLIFPDNMTIVPGELFSSRKIKINAIIGKNIKGDEKILSYINTHCLVYLYLPNYEITDKNLNIFNGINSFLLKSEFNLRVCFKGFCGTLGVLSILHKRNRYTKQYSKRFLNLVSYCVEHEFNEDGTCTIGRECLYHDIYGISLLDNIGSTSEKVWQPGVDVQLSYIPSWTDYHENDFISERGKQLLSTGNFIMDKSITVLSEYCFEISDEVQEKIGVLNVELSPMLKFIDSKSFNNLQCLEGITVVNKPKLHYNWVCNCRNLKYINLLSYNLSEFDVSYIHTCNDSTILQLHDWSGTIKECKELSAK